MRHLLLVEGARRAGALLGADRAWPAAARLALPAAPAARPARSPARRDAVRPGQHRLARHGHLQGQGHGAGQPPRRDAAEDLRAHRRRRAAGRAVLGVARVGRHARPRRDHRRHRSQQDPVRHLGARGQPARRSRREAARLRLARGAVRRPRRRRAGARVPGVRRRPRSAEGAHCRHHQGARRELHGRARPRWRRPSSTSFTRARRPSQQYLAGLKELLATANARFAELRSRRGGDGDAHPQPAPRAAPDRQPRGAPTRRRWWRSATRARTCWRSTPT